MDACGYMFTCMSVHVCVHKHIVRPLDDCLGVYSSLFLCHCDKIPWPKLVIEEILSLFYGPTGRMSKMS